MKNKKIINSLNKTLPNDKKKNIILNNIMNKEKTKNKYYYSIGAVAFCLVLCISIIIFNNSSVTNLPIYKSNDNQVIYNSKCYQEKGIYNGNYDSLEFVEETNEFIMGDKIYKKGNSIFFKNNENYIEYIECERN